MQGSRQKGGQIGLFEAAAQNALGSTRFSQAAKKSATELRNIVGLTVRERVLHRMPGGFDRIEFWCVSGQLLQMQARVLVTELMQALPVVDRGTVPNDDDMAAQMFEQVPKKVVYLIARDILRVQPEVEPEPPAFRTDREAANDRDPGVVVVVADDRGLTDQPPGTPDGWNQHEARFVGEDDVRTQPRSVFFTRGQSLRFHCSIRDSSRSSARLSGFWQLKPNSCSRRAA